MVAYLDLKYSIIAESCGFCSQPCAYFSASVMRVCTPSWSVSVLNGVLSSL